MRFDESLFERFAMTRAGYLFMLHAAPHIDKTVTPRTKRPAQLGRHRQGRARDEHKRQVRTAAHASAGIGGRRSWAAGYRVQLRAPNHPAWSTNLLAHPECTIEFTGPPKRYQAELLTGDARAAAWATAVNFYAGYESYRTSCAPREIRVFRLLPVAA
jgi:deazaflavin-dependent oxidoreductase (nitroreductase family)